MKPTLTLLTALLLAPLAALHAADLSSLRPPLHLGARKAEHAVTNRAFTVIPSLTIADDLKQPPDYWVMSTYAHCDPAPDGFRYLHKIVEILGPANAGRILSTDLKGAGHEDEIRATILNRQGQAGPDSLRWHLAKCREYGFAGWWMWAYQDTPTSKVGLRSLDGRWKRELVCEIVKSQDD